jgi:hypothetical protein
MVRLFSPCNRLHDERFQELNLNVSTEVLLSAERAFTYADLYAVLGNEETVAWLTPHAHAAILRANQDQYVPTYLDWNYKCSFNADGRITIALANSHEHLLEICDVLLRLLAASIVHSVILRNWNNHHSVSIHAPTLSYVMEQCPSLKCLSLYGLAMDENHSRVLGSYSRPDLEIELINCAITGSGAITLAEVLGQNQGPTRLERCESDYSVLADGLRGNCRLKYFMPDFSSSFDDRQVLAIQVLAIANAVRENKGLVELIFYGFHTSDETWGAICDSLKTHPTLEVVDLAPTSVYALEARPPRAPDVTTSRIQALADMMKVNTSIYSIHVSNFYSETKIYRESVTPYLETNRLRPCLLAIQKTRPIAYRAKLLGRALLSARTNANMFWMLLSGNAEVAFLSRTTTIEAVENIPTPAAAALTSALTTTVTGILSTATAATAARAAIPSTASASDAFASTPTVAAASAANVATPSVGQKRKASP